MGFFHKYLWSYKKFCETFEMREFSHITIKQTYLDYITYSSYIEARNGIITKFGIKKVHNSISRMCFNSHASIFDSTFDWELQHNLTNIYTRMGFVFCWQLYYFVYKIYYFCDLFSTNNENQSDYFNQLNPFHDICQDWVTAVEII